MNPLLPIRFLQPPKLLRPFISNYFVIESAPGDEISISEPTPPFPIGGISFIYQHNQPIWIEAVKEGRFKLPDMYFIPPTTHNYIVEATSGIGAIGALFRPGKFFEFFGWPQHLFTDTKVLPEDTEAKDAFEEVYEKIMRSRNEKERIDHLNSFLLNRLRMVRTGNLGIQQALAAIENGELPRLTPGKLASKLGMTDRHLRRLFSEQLGMSPGVYLRINRFYRSFWALQLDPNQSLTKLALANGYYDQAHFIRDFRFYTRFTPSQFIAHQSVIAKELAWRPPQSKSQN